MVLQPKQKVAYNLYPGSKVPWQSLTSKHSSKWGKIGISCNKWNIATGFELATT